MMCKMHCHNGVYLTHHWPFVDATSAHHDTLSRQVRKVIFGSISFKYCLQFLVFYVSMSFACAFLRAYSSVEECALSPNVSSR